MCCVLFDACDPCACDPAQVRMEDASVTAEDIQCAVQQALFSAGARSKRLRREDSNATMHVH